MRFRLKATGFSLNPSLQALSEEKLLKPLERRLKSIADEDTPVDVELAKTTRHHEEGKIWKCEVNLALPYEGKTIYVKAFEETLEAAIDEAKDELEREIGEYKEKRMAKFLRVARKLKDGLRFAGLGKGARYLYRWVRRK